MLASHLLVSPLLVPPLLASRLPQTSSDWIVFGSIFAVVILALIANDLRHRRRRRQLLAAARELGLESVELNTPEAAFIHTNVKGQRSHKLRLCAVGFLGGRSARLSEYTFTTGSGRHSHTHYNLQLSQECPPDWPTVALADRPDFMHRPITQIFSKAKPVTDDAAFDHRWAVQASDEARAKKLFGPDVRALLLNGGKNEFWSVQDGWLTCTWRRVCGPADLTRLVARTEAVHAAVAAALDG
jgi:hypothetical protein